MASSSGRVLFKYQHLVRHFIYDSGNLNLSRELIVSKGFTLRLRRLPDLLLARTPPECLRLRNILDRLAARLLHVPGVIHNWADNRRWLLVSSSRDRIFPDLLWILHDEPLHQVLAVLARSRDYHGYRVRMSLSSGSSTCFATFSSEETRFSDGNLHSWKWTG